MMAPGRVSTRRLPSGDQARAVAGTSATGEPCSSTMAVDAPSGLATASSPREDHRASPPGTENRACPLVSYTTAWVGPGPAIAAIRDPSGDHGDAVAQPTPRGAVWSDWTSTRKSEHTSTPISLTKSREPSGENANGPVSVPVVPVKGGSCRSPVPSERAR